jgi:hypothetical protein
VYCQCTLGVLLNVSHVECKVLKTTLTRVGRSSTLASSALCSNYLRILLHGTICPCVELYIPFVSIIPRHRNAFMGAVHIQPLKVQVHSVVPFP